MDSELLNQKMGIIWNEMTTWIFVFQSNYEILMEIERKTDIYILYVEAITTFKFY